jgi:hypothetical protein
MSTPGPEHARPYDPTIFGDYTGQILAQHVAGVSYPHVLDRPTPEHHTPPHPAGYEDHPGIIPQSGAAIGGLFKVFTRDGRAQLAQRRDNRAERISHHANRIRDPRHYPIDPGTPMTTTDRSGNEVEVTDPSGDVVYVPGQEPILAPGDNPSAKLGWHGTGNQYHPRSGTGPTDLANTYNRLMRKEPATPRAARPNRLRPQTRAEKAVERRLDLAEERRTKAADDAEWLHHSYGDSLHSGPGQASLSTAEQRHMRQTAKHAAKLGKKVLKAQRKFDKMADSRDWRGRLPW